MGAVVHSDRTDFELFTPLRGKVRPHRHETFAQQKRRIARFSRLTLPKTPLRTVFYSVFMLCEAETTANSDVFELAVAQMNLLSKNTAICDVFNNMVAKNTAICEFFTFSRKELKPRQCTKSLQKRMFLPNKNGESRHPNSSEITKSGLPLRQDTWKTYEKRHVSKPKIEDHKSKDT